jgi:hypothetical protein
MDDAKNGEPAVQGRRVRANDVGDVYGVLWANEMQMNAVNHRSQEGARQRENHPSYLPV